MDTEELRSALAAGASRLVTGTVIEIEEGGGIGVVAPGDPPLRVHCDVLVTATTPQLLLALGQRVLVLLPAPGAERGCVLGLIGPYTAPRTPETPSRVRIEAQQELVLECGDASLTLREDGRVTIRGTDVTSHARRTQRIRGGTVHIN